MRDPAYGGGLLHRAQVFFDVFLALVRRRALRCEIIVVEWNPVPDAPRFRESLKWPTSLGSVTLRFIDVPAAIHRQLPNAALIPFMNTRARNVGIRRAVGDYVLVTAADVVPNAPLIRFLAEGGLSERAFYRIDRRDLARSLPARLPPAWLRALCRCQDVKVNTYYGEIHERRMWWPFARREARRRHRAVLDAYERYRADPQYWLPSDRVGDDRLLIPADGLHRNASGEFFLMHRSRWHELRGYTELPTRGHGDSLMCWTAASAGLEQVILAPPARLFHQPHDRETASGWPVTDWVPWFQRYLECRREGTALITNADDWGLRDETLPEWTSRANGAVVERVS